MTIRPLIVFCTTCKGRVQHLELTLRQNILDNRDYERCKFVVLDYGDDPQLGDFLRNTFPGEIKSGKLSAHRYDACGPFRMAHAKNMAHRCGMYEGADILVNLDADNFTGVGFASYIADEFEKAHAANQPIFICASTVLDSSGDYGICGRIALSRNAFLKTGGYDEKFDTYSPDDADLILRLQRLGYKPVTLDKPFMTWISHGHEVRYREYRPTQNFGALKTRAQYADNTIVNYGKIGMGLVCRNFGTDRIEFGCMPAIDLRVLPTRIFGIGMHKTATTSLHAALRILGFDSAHWMGADWAKLIWDEMQSAGRSITVEKHYALLDLPISIMYERLDAVYPGSKFILTVRDEKTWLASIEKHWKRGVNPMRESWDVDMMSHRLHKLVYGQKSFNPGMFLETYRQHVSEAKDYFRYRSKDFLMLDLEKGDGWPQLCRFLNVPEPVVPYPTMRSAELSPELAPLR